jgi:hypothetical protein
LGSCQRQICDGWNTPDYEALVCQINFELRCVLYGAMRSFKLDFLTDLDALFPESRPAAFTKYGLTPIYVAVDAFGILRGLGVQYVRQTTKGEVGK